MFDFWFSPLPFLFTHLVLIEILIINCSGWCMNINFSVCNTAKAVPLQRFHFHNWKMLHAIKIRRSFSRQAMCISEIKSNFAKSCSTDLYIYKTSINWSSWIYTKLWQNKIIRMNWERERESIGSIIRRHNVHIHLKLVIHRTIRIDEQRLTDIQFAIAASWCPPRNNS